MSQIAPDALAQMLAELAEGEALGADHAVSSEVVPPQAQEPSPRRIRFAQPQPQAFAGLADDEAERPLPVSHRRTAAGAGFAQAVLAPVFLVVGLLVSLPAVWGTMTLMGRSLPGFPEHADAAEMAKVMLLGWPLGLALLGTGFWYLLRVVRGG